eukprot:4822919-Alexandrium_andersonii.AAC.1
MQPASVSLRTFRPGLAEAHKQVHARALAHSWHRTSPGAHRARGTIIETHTGIETETEIVLLVISPRLSDRSACVRSHALAP